MTMKDLTCEDFTQVLGSKQPVPGGGGASALVGAVGVSLGSMVGALTTGKKKYEDNESDIKRFMAEAEKLRTELMDLIQKDADCFQPLAKAYGMPADTDEQKEAKAAVMEQALRIACEAPLEIMKKCCRAIELHKEFASKGSRLALSDAGVGAIFCKSALQGASLNVFINTGAMKDRDYAASVGGKAQNMLDTYCRQADEVFEYVREHL